MNSLFSSSFAKYRASDDPNMVDVELAAQPTSGNADLSRFFADVDSVKSELAELESLHRHLHDANETSKSLHRSSDVCSLRVQMDSDVSSALKKAKVLKLKLESLDRANAHNRSIPGCGPGSVADRQRTSVVSNLRRNLKDTMDSFSSLRKHIAEDHRQAVGRRYFTVTGTSPEENVLDELIQSGEADKILEKAIRQQGGRGEMMDVVIEVRERHDAAKEIERSLLELQQVFLDMAVLVEAQGEELNDIESNVDRANSFVAHGTEKLQEARTHQKSTRKWTFIAIIILIIIILIIVIPIVVSNSRRTGTEN